MSRGSLMIVWRTGAGSARPVVSITMRSKRMMSPVSRRLEEIEQRIDQFAADGAAQAARGHLDDIVVGLLDQQMIDADFAELVDDDGGGRRASDRAAGN